MLKKAFSLRRNLLITFLALWLVSVVLATFAAFWLSGRAAAVSFDRILKDDALALAAQIKWQPEGASFSLDTNTADLVIFDSSSPSQFALFDKQLHRIAGDLSAEIPINFAKLRGNEPNFFDITTQQGLVRVVALKIDHATEDFVWVVVAESNAKRSDISHELAAAIFLPAVGLAFLVVPLLLAGIRYGLAPAQTISEAVSRKGINDLSPLKLEGVPEELRVVILHINDLLTRLQVAIEHERRFIADAAHQLRTPIAGIKLLAEDLVRTHKTNAHEPPDEEVLQELNAAATRATHLVRQLLSLARTERPLQQEQQSFALKDVLLEVFEQWRKPVAAAHKQLQLQADLSALENLNVKGSAVLVGEALGNIIDNAIQYGGESITLMAHRVDQTVHISVTDNGYAVAPHEVDLMLTPFWRGANASAVGVGLGLPIAAKAIQNMGGQLQIKTRPEVNGTQLVLVLPCPSL